MSNPDNVPAESALEQVYSGNIPGDWANFEYRSKTAILWLIIRLRDAIICCSALFLLLLAFEILPFDPVSDLINAVTGRGRRVPWLGLIYMLGLLAVTSMVIVLVAYRPVRILLAGKKNVLVIAPGFIVKSLGGRTQYFAMSDIEGVSEAIIERLYTGALFYGVFGEGWHKRAVSLRICNQRRLERLISRGHFGPTVPIAQHISNYLSTVSAHSASNTPD